MSIEISIGARVRKSPYFDATVAAGVARFTVYNRMYLPVSYGDPEGEYWRLINDVSLWDVAVQRQVEVSGPGAEALVRYLVPRDLSGCQIGQGKYVPLCDHAGRLINDPVLLKLAEGRYWFSIADLDMLMWVSAVAAERGLDVRVTEPDVSPLAVQGPKAVDLVSDLFGDWVRSLKYFWFREVELDGIPLQLVRAGWSKQGGFELFLQDGSLGLKLWDRLMEAGRRYGIGAGTPNPTERIESALLSFGGDTDAQSNPFEVRLGRYLSLDREDDFIGKKALRQIAREGPSRLQVGLFIGGAALPLNEECWPVVLAGRTVGKVTAAAYSWRLERNIAMALIEREVAEAGSSVAVLSVDGPRQAQLTKLPFC
jgi:aminomethyltransferase